MQCIVLLVGYTTYTVYRTVGRQYNIYVLRWYVESRAPCPGCPGVEADDVLPRGP